MTKVCRKFAVFCARKPFRTLTQLYFTLLHSFLAQARFRKLLNVMHHAIQAPLRIDLGAAPVVQTAQALVVTDVGCRPAAQS